MSIKKPNAWIASTKDNGRKPIKKINGDDTVYLYDNEEFLIELFNPMKFCVLADIKLNGNSISRTGIVLNPGQRFYLDCFIDNGKKFVFKTYNVDNTEEVLEAISYNGIMEVNFFKETVKSIVKWPTSFGRSFGRDINYIPGKETFSSKIETGRIEAGNKSNQEFKIVEMDFDTFILSSTRVYILPVSRRPVEPKNISKETFNALEIIEKLSDLHKSGILTDDEFKLKKVELLSRI